MPAALCTKKLGFRVLGTYRNTGYKNGRWRDVVWFEKPIGSFTDEPQPSSPSPGSRTPPPSSRPPTHKPTTAPRRQKQRGARRFGREKDRNQQEATPGCLRATRMWFTF